jgi:hypothetical protein
MMEGLGCVFISSKYRVTKGFKFHARPQTGAYSCYLISSPVAVVQETPWAEAGELLF